MQKQEIFPALGTVNTITIYEENGQALTEAVMRVRELHRKLSMFDENSEISRINQLAGKKAVAVSDDTFCLIVNSICFSKYTNGCFDITSAPLNLLWKRAIKSGRIPSN